MLVLSPGLALAHWLAATVFVARQAHDLALQSVRDGCAAQDTQPPGSSRLGAVGLHLLHGLLLAAQGATDAAIVELERELAHVEPEHVYGRECAANTWYALGALHLRARRHEAAVAAFHEALARVPGHALAAIGLSAASSSPTAIPSRTDAHPVDAAIAAAASLTLQGRHGDAAARCDSALQHAEPGPHGWGIPVEPLLHVGARSSVWASALARLRARGL